MRKLLAALFLILFVLASHGGGIWWNQNRRITQPGIAQSYWTNSTATSPIKITMANVKSGSLVVVLMMRAGTGVAAITAANSISDTVAAYQLDASSSTLNANIQMAALSRRTAVAGTINLFLTNLTTGKAINACVYEITNAASANWLDMAQVNTFSSSTAVSSGAFNTTTNCVIVAMEGDGSSGAGTTHTVLSPFTKSVNGTASIDSGATFWAAGAADYTATSPLMNKQAQMTLGNAQSGLCLMAAYGGQSSTNFTLFCTAENGSDGDIAGTNTFNLSSYGCYSNSLNVWSTGPTANQLLTAQVLAGSNVTLNSQVTIAGVKYNGSGTRTIGMVNSTYEFMDYTLPVPSSNASVGLFFTPMMTNSADSTFYDAFMWSGALDFCVASVQMAGTSPTVPLKVHTQAGSSVGTINLTAQHTYWVTMRYVAGDKGYIRVYDPASNWAQVGSEISLAVSNYPCASFRIGENHAVTPPSTTVSYYDDLIIDSYKGTWPLGP